MIKRAVSTNTTTDTELVSQRLVLAEQRRLVIEAVEVTAKIFAQNEIRELCEQNRLKQPKLSQYEEE